MELKSFVKETIKAVLDAIIELQADETVGDYVSPAIRKIGPTKNYDESSITNSPIDEIVFDVAVTAEEQSNTSAGAKVSIPPFKAGVDAEKGQGLTNISKIQFRVPISYPRKKRVENA